MNRKFLKNKQLKSENGSISEMKEKIIRLSRSHMRKEISKRVDKST